MRGLGVNCQTFVHLLCQCGRLLLHAAEQPGVFIRDRYLGGQGDGQPFVNLTEGVAPQFIGETQPAMDLHLIADEHAKE
jgi:hypothetical protein